VICGISPSSATSRSASPRGTYHVNLALAAITIGTVSVTLPLTGLELGDWIGTKTGERGELLGGLIPAGVAVASGIF